MEELTVEATSDAIAAAGVAEAVRTMLARHPDVSDIHTVGARVLDRIVSKAAAAEVAERVRVADEAAAAAAAAAAGGGRDGSAKKKKERKKKPKKKPKKKKPSAAKEEEE